MIALQRLAQAFSPLLQAEGHHRGVAAEGSRQGARFEIVGLDDVRTGGLRAVNMAVDPARQYEPAARIHSLVGRAQIIAERRDQAVPYAHVAIEGVGGSDDSPAAND